MKPEMRKDERYGRLSRDARELFNGLITVADDEGRFRALSSLICGDVFPYDEDAPRKLRAWVKEVQDSGMILFYVVEGVPYGAFRHWRRHQRINRPTPSELPPPPDPEIVAENGVPNHDLITERDVNESGGARDQITTQSSHAHSLARRRAFRSDPIPVVEELKRDDKMSADQRIELLSELLAARIVANDPQANANPFSDRWLTDMRLLLADRDGDWREVMRVLDWCQADSFWRCNVLSPAKLRKQFTQLRLKAQAPPGGSVVRLNRKESAGDLLNEIHGGQVA